MQGFVPPRCRSSSAETPLHCASDSGDLVALDEQVLAHGIRICVAAIGTPEYDAVLERADGSDQWRCVAGLVKQLADILNQTLPAFWKIARSYIDGKYQKVKELDRWRPRRR